MIKKARNVKIFGIIGVVFFFIIFGIYVYSKQELAIVINIKNNFHNLHLITYKDLVFYLILLGISLLFSIIYIGIIFPLSLICYESFSIGYILSCFISLFKTKGLFISTLYIVLYKLLLIFLLIILCLKYLKISSNFFKKIKDSNVDFSKTILNSLYIIFFILIYQSILLLFDRYIINFFTILIK